MKHIIKRDGYKEDFEPRKVYASVYATCVTLRMADTEAELIAQSVTDGIEQWIANKASVSSHQISRQVIKLLSYYHPEAAYLYEHHRDLS